LGLPHIYTVILSYISYTVKKYIYIPMWPLWLKRVQTPHPLGNFFSGSCGRFALYTCGTRLLQPIASAAAPSRPSLRSCPCGRTSGAAPVGRAPGCALVATPSRLTFLSPCRTSCRRSRTPELPHWGRARCDLKPELLTTALPTSPTLPTSPVLIAAWGWAGSAGLLLKGASRPTALGRFPGLSRFPAQAARLVLVVFMDGGSASLARRRRLTTVRIIHRGGLPFSPLV
jgi:hypothetical protein